ncbi:hypothetical protein D3C71_1308070 [compost metagenome]
MFHYQIIRPIRRQADDAVHLGLAQVARFVVSFRLQDVAGNVILGDPSLRLGGVAAREQVEVEASSGQTERLVRRLIQRIPRIISAGDDQRLASGVRVERRVLGGDGEIAGAVVVNGVDRFQLSIQNA